MQAKDLREKFLKFFAQRNHAIISSASLLPDNDPTVLFTTAGMHPLVPYLMGESHPGGRRLTSVQKCLRTGDIDEVGDKTHHTFFEMLGNWSLGDYDEKQAVIYAWEFVTKILKLKKDKIAISIFGGNQDVKDYDQAAEKYWLDLGIESERIARVADNWWGPAGQTGPCGPDTEIFYWTGEGKAPAKFDENDKGWVEIWNNVFMKYHKTATGKFEELKQKNIDTGMGLERTLAVLNKTDDNYATELFQPIIKAIERLSSKKYSEMPREFRIIADHIRSAVFVLGDPKGVAPSNKDQGYVVRRLIRRAITLANVLGISQSFTADLAKVIIKNYQSAYPELADNQKFIIEQLGNEEIKFTLTLQRAAKELDKIGDKIDEAKAFDLMSTFGLSFEITARIVFDKFGIKLDEQKFKSAMAKHQDLSRTASAGMFKGGLADDSVMSRRYHTATHLLHRALKIVLGEHVEQRGSHINQERLRFDFVHSDKMSAEQISKVEEIVNNQIKRELPVSWQEMTVEQAKQAGAIGLFGHKYGDKVKVYSVGDFSKEICGGPHVDNSSELGHFKITKEESSSAGIRRIKAILE